MALYAPNARAIFALFASCFAVTSASSHAAVILSGPVAINVPSTAAGVYFNVVTREFGTSFATAPTGWDLNLWGSTALNASTPSPSPGGGAYVGAGNSFNNILFSFGTVIGPSNTFCNAGVVTVNPSTPLNLNSANNGLGFRFVNEATGNQVHYGALRLSLGATPGGQPRFVVEYAYESLPGVELRMPSPGVAGLFVVGAISLNRRRR